jgi:hypothetical protein
VVVVVAISLVVVAVVVFEPLPADLVLLRLHLQYSLQHFLVQKYLSQVVKVAVSV